MMGGVAIEPYPVVALAALLVVVATVVLLLDARSLDLLALGDEGARSLGVDADAVRRRVFLASSLLVGAVVSLCGIISFAGLVVPHVLRRLLGSDNRLLLPASFLGGAAFLVTCDALARWVAAPAELPVGAVTAMVGAPYFVHLLRRGHGRRGSIA
jgi:iron complex transport system permease protein